jgi:hypothetical protein
MATSLVESSWIDHSSEVGRSKLHIVQLTAGNIVATLALVDTLNETTDAILQGTRSHTRVVAVDTPGSQTPPEGNDAQREAKLMVRYQDDTTKQIYRVEYPCILWTILNGAGPSGDFVDPDNSGWQAYVAAFEAVVKSADGNAVTVLDGQYVGKRL